MAEKREIKFESTEKYLRKLDGSLAGKSYRFVMDEGEEYEVRFVTGEIAEWQTEEMPLRWERYGCLKSDEKTYFVASQLGGTEVRTLVTLVIDEEQSLVTLAISRIGQYPLRPRLATVEFHFGAIRVPGQPLPYKRHGFTNELAHKKITWHYSTGFINTQIYQSEKFCRIRPLQRPADPQTVAAEEQRQREIREGTSKEMLYDESAWFIKIKTGMYLISFVEENINKVDNLRGGNNLMLLSNMVEGFDCGRTFSNNNSQQPEHGLFIAYGDFTDEDIDVEHVPSPYRV